MRTLEFSRQVEEWITRRVVSPVEQGTRAAAEAWNPVAKREPQRRPPAPLNAEPQESPLGNGVWVAWRKYAQWQCKFIAHRQVP